MNFLSFSFLCRFLDDRPLFCGLRFQEKSPLLNDVASDTDFAKAHGELRSAVRLNVRSALAFRQH